MPDPTHAEQMVAKYQQMLLDMGGLQSVNVDGQQVSYQDLKTELDYWEKKVKSEQGRRASLRRIVLG